MTVLKEVGSYVLLVYLLVLITRMIFSWIQVYARSWSPHGVLLVLAEGVYSATDPPLRLLRRYIPSVRLGSVALDLSFMLLFLVVFVLWQLAQ